MSTGPAYVQGKFTQGVGPNGQAVNNFAINFPEQVGSGNTLLLVVYNNADATSVPNSISDTVNGSWSTTADASCVGAACRTDIYRFSSSGTGRAKLSIGYASSLQGPMFVMLEFSGLDVSSPFSGHSSAADQIWGGGATPLQCGPFTPTLNNSQGGNVVLSFFVCSTGGGASGATSLFTASSTDASAPNILLAADIGWVGTTGGLSKACAMQFQANSASINCQMQPTGNTTDKFNCLAVSYKGKLNQGTPIPSGIRILKDTFFFISGSQPNPWTHHTPMLGDTMLALSAFTEFTSVTDSASNTWNFVTSDATPPTTSNSQHWWMQPAGGANASLLTHFNGSTGGQGRIRVFDIMGGKRGAGLIGANVNTITSTQIPGTGGTISHQPDITPTTQSALVIMYGPVGNGGEDIMQTPTGADACDDTVQYANANDADANNSGDCWGHFRVTSSQVNVSLNVSWNIIPQPVASTGMVIHAVEYLPAPVIPPVVVSLAFGIIGLGSSEW